MRNEISAEKKCEKDREKVEKEEIHEELQPGGKKGKRGL